MRSFASSIDLARELSDTLFGGSIGASDIKNVIVNMKNPPEFPLTKGSVEYELTQRSVWARLSDQAEFPFSSDFGTLAQSLLGLSFDEQEAQIVLIADFCTDTFDAKQDFVEELRETLTTIEAA